MLLHTFFSLELFFLLVFYPWRIFTDAQSLTNPIFWQVPVVFNVSNPLDQGSMVLSDSRLAISHDFQVVHAGDDVGNEHKRLLINMDNGCSNSTSLTTIQQWNNQLLTSTMIQSLPKMALIERGDCTWHQKVSVVHDLSLLYHLNIEAMMIYDNSTPANASFELHHVDANERTPPLYNTPLPPSRNITYMKDNDLFRNMNNTTSNIYLPIYFTTKDYGLYLKQLNSSSPIENVHQFYQLTPYLSTTLLNSNNNNNNNNSDGENNSGNFSDMLATSKGYLAYIIALVALLLIAVLLLRYLRLRRIRRQLTTENQNGQGLHTNFILQSRENRIDPLPVPVVNALPVVYYSVDTISNAMCVICLDDYVENKSQVRMLPCRHGFCVLCIDPWLTQKSSLCPICKYDCLPSDQRHQREQQESSGNHHTIDMADSIITTITPNENRVDQSSSTTPGQSNQPQH